MLIALLAVLGVDLIVIVAIAAFVIARKRCVRRQDGVFRGPIRVESGHLDGLGEKWSRGYGRWVRDVLVWTNGPFPLGVAKVEVATRREHRELLLTSYRKPVSAR